eukprot:TRINITY_DN43221_c0_g1_i1.p2 TRINITY_DN43221_c0_g1~~TRINITY_DN43221_c0_g1_i1.p2  ORF type:complete len:222 (+),score=20.67 TRINITY_DN43221_c0_g1_i1:394-1059(+)
MLDGFEQILSEIVYRLPPKKYWSSGICKIVNIIVKPRRNIADQKVAIYLRVPMGSSCSNRRSSSGAVTVLVNATMGLSRSVRCSSIGDVRILADATRPEDVRTREGKTSMGATACVVVSIGEEIILEDTTGLEVICMGEVEIRSAGLDCANGAARTRVGAWHGMSCIIVSSCADSMKFPDCASSSRLIGRSDRTVPLCKRAEEGGGIDNRLSVYMGTDRDQ